MYAAGPATLAFLPRVARVEHYANAYPRLYSKSLTPPVSGLWATYRHLIQIHFIFYREQENKLLRAITV